MMVNKLIFMGGEVKRHLIAPITNRDMFCKPLGGLWTSPCVEGEEHLSDWHRWCDNKSFIDYTGQVCTILKLKEDAKIYIIDSTEDANALIPKYKIKDNPTIKFIFNSPLLDYEKMAQDYDAIYLTSKGEIETRWTGGVNEVNLYGWDCSTVLILNPDSINWEELETIIWNTIN